MEAEDIRKAREGIRFTRRAEKDPLWHVITIRMRVPRPFPEILGSTAGDAAGRRLYLFCVNVLAGAGILEDEAADDARKLVNAVYDAKEKS